MILHSYHHLLHYIPVRFQGLSASQLQDRKEVFNFKDGNCSTPIKQKLLAKVREIISSNPSSWVICFIPASTKAKTFNRYSSLAIFLSREAGCNVYIDAIATLTDSQAGHISGKSNNPAENFIFNSSYFKGKKVLLIDDVITRGRTFEGTAMKLESLGALNVIGLFIAKTIHPNLPQSTSSFIDNEFYEDLIDEQELAIQMAEEEMIDEMEIEEAMYDDFDPCDFD